MTRQHEYRGELYYYQGYHDFVSVFLLTLGENLGFYCADAASRFLVWDYLLENFEPGVIPALKLLMHLLSKADQECYELIISCGDLPTFTLSWLLTWYSHVLPSLAVTQRLFDAILANSTNSLYPLYLIISTIIVNRELLIDNFDEDDPHTSLYMIF